MKAVFWMTDSKQEFITDFLKFNISLILHGQCMLTSIFIQIQLKLLFSQCYCCDLIQLCISIYIYGRYTILHMLYIVATQQ